MTAQELIKHLQKLPPTTKIVVRGYKDGYNDILQLNEVKIKPKAEAYWFDGEYMTAPMLMQSLPLTYTAITKIQKTT